jgi:hypothetical protein
MSNHTANFGGAFGVPLGIITIALIGYALFSMFQF